MVVVSSDAALVDLIAIQDFIATDNPARAATFLKELEEALASLARAPQRGAPRDYIVPGLRLIAHGQYNIFYRVLDGGIRVERVLHSAREVEQAFG
ncbi:MAG: type II toxin-antitoxin system RelE/ParE family toxin [Caulobacterales bacterium]|nr:type II toxin-antitoxin system RelE/ParE family toxin [Caulobacterales bacterium]